MKNGLENFAFVNIFAGTMKQSKHTKQKRRFQGEGV